MLFIWKVHPEISLFYLKNGYNKKKQGQCNAAPQKAILCETKSNHLLIFNILSQPLDTLSYSVYHFLFGLSQQQQFRNSIHTMIQLVDFLLDEFF